MSGDEEAVYGDKAYESKRRRLWLRSLGIKDRTMHRSHKVQRGLPHWQQRHNELISPVRSAVEKVFGTLKRSYRYHRVRYRGLERNAIEMCFKVMAYEPEKVGPDSLWFCLGRGVERVESDELNLPETLEMQMSAPVDFSLASNEAMAPHPEQGCLPIGPSYAKVSLRGRGRPAWRGSGWPAR